MAKRDAAARLTAERHATLLKSLKRYFADEFDEPPSEFEIEGEISGRDP